MDEFYARKSYEENKKKLEKEEQKEDSEEDEEDIAFTLGDILKFFLVFGFTSFNIWLYTHRAVIEIDPKTKFYIYFNQKVRPSEVSPAMT